MTILTINSTIRKQNKTKKSGGGSCKFIAVSNKPAIIIIKNKPAINICQQILGWAYISLLLVNEGMKELGNAINVFLNL